MFQTSSAAEVVIPEAWAHLGERAWRYVELGLNPLSQPAKTNHMERSMLRCASFCVLLATSMNALSLDTVSSIPESHQKVVKQIKDGLGLKSTDKTIDKKIYGKLDHSLKDGWYSYWVGNRDLDKSNFKDDKVRVVDVIIPSNDRINNVTYIYFPSAGQIFYTQREYIEGSSSITLEAFQKAKENLDMKKLSEADNYAFFQKISTASFSIYHVKAPNGGVAYFDYGVIDVR